MSKECKTARNTIGLAILILVTLLLTLQSCSGPAHCAGNNWAANCPAYR